MPDQDARIAELEGVLWTLWCCVQAAQRELPASNPVAVVISAAERHCAPVAQSVLDTSRERMAA